MTAASADSSDLARIRALASNADKVGVQNQARSDMMARNLRLDGICELIVEWIDAGERVKPTILHSFASRVGQNAWEIKPKIDEVLFYIKVTVDDPGGPDESLVILSCHPDH